MLTNKYVGIPYKANGRDETGLDCWGLVRLVYSEEFNINLPSFSTDYTISDNARIEELIDQYREGWKEESTPEEGSVVLFRILGTETHVGIAVSNTHFIHVREGSDVAIESFESLKWSKRISGYYKYSIGAVLNAVPHPLKTERITVPIPEGTTVAQLYEWVNKEYKINPELKKQVHIFINSRVVPEDQWDTTIIKDTDVIEYRAVPTGSGGRMLMLLVLVAAVITMQPQLAALALEMGVPAGFATNLAVGAMSAAMMAAGGALINALAPIRPPKPDGQPGQANPQLMFTGAANQFNPYGAVPVVLGKVRLTPPVGAITYLSYGGFTSKTAVARAYIRSSTVPITNPGTCTYNFVKDTLTTALSNGWTSFVPSGSDQLYIIHILYIR